MGSPSSARYETKILPIEKLGDDTIRRMTSLYLDCFDGSSEALFRGDLAEKDEVILLVSQDQLVGFTALKMFRTEWNSAPASILYSGDTVVAPAHWGQQALAFAWIARIGAIKRSAPDLPFYWFLLVKGHRTFKYLPVFGKSFFPHWCEERPDLAGLAEKLARERFGAAYDVATGTVRFPESRGRLRKEIAEPSPEELKKSAVRFFLERNPGYRDGEELVCLCELEAFNMKPLTARIFQGKGTAAP